MYFESKAFIFQVKRLCQRFLSNLLYMWPRKAATLFPVRKYQAQNAEIVLKVETITSTVKTHLKGFEELNFLFD